MQGTQLALPFVSSFKSIMQRSQVSCSTNVHHLMTREMDRAGEVPQSSPWGLFWPSHLFWDSIILMLPFKFLFFNISSFSHVNKFLHRSLSPLYFSGSCKTFSAKCQTCLSGIVSSDLKIKHRQTPVHPTAVLTLHTCLRWKFPYLHEYTQSNQPNMYKYAPSILPRILSCNRLILNLILIPITRSLP